MNRFMTALPCIALSMIILSLPARAAPLAYGKYGCVSSKFKASTGMYEYTQRGSVTLSANGKYSYLGFEKPSTGKYSADPASGKISFTGGYLDKGEATPIKGDVNRFYLVTPTLLEHRWTCGLK